MAALALSNVEEVADYLHLDADDEDYGVLGHVLDIGREQITAMVKPAADLPDPLPRSLHEACTVRAAEVFANRTGRYGYTDPAEEGAPAPPYFIIKDLIGPWARPKAGVGPNNSAQVFDDDW